MTGPILRAPVLWVAQSPWFRRLATESTPGRRVAERFVAGVTLDDAMSVVRDLSGRGVTGMLDHLGENVESPDQATAAAGSYIAAVRRIRDEALDCAVSIKLSQLGLDFSTALCLAEVERVLGEADEAGVVVMIDMEGSAYVERTLAVYRELRGRHERVGVCLQSYLRRTPQDVFGLPEGSRVRLVKGAYLEPPEMAYTRRREVDAAFRRLFATLLTLGHSIDLATHDAELIEGARRFVGRRGVPRSRVEFQMLYGVRRDLQGRLAEEGYPVRVYVPYGTEWYPYLTRRLAERPANMWFFVSNLVRSRE